MQSNVLRNHLEAVGAHEDEIKVLTHSSTEEYQDLLLLLVTGHCKMLPSTNTFSTFRKLAIKLDAVRE